MVHLLLLWVLGGIAFSQAESNILLNLTFPTETLAEEQIEDWIKYIKIVRDPSATKEQKLISIQELLKNETAEETKEALAQSGLVIDLNDWINSEIKNASPKVKEAFNKYFELLCDSTFWMKTTSEKVAQLEAVGENLNDEEKKELKVFEEANLEKAKELGVLDLISQEESKKRR